MDLDDKGKVKEKPFRDGRRIPPPRGQVKTAIYKQINYWFVPGIQTKEKHKMDLDPYPSLVPPVMRLDDRAKWKEKLALHGKVEEQTDVVEAAEQPDVVKAAEQPDVVDPFVLSFSYHGKPLLRLNYLFSCEYEFFLNDLDFLWNLFGGLYFTVSMNLLFNFSRIDHTTGIPMYKLNKMAVNHFQDIRGDLTEDDVGLVDEYLKIDDIGSYIPKKARHVSVRGGIDASVLTSLYQAKALQTLLILRESGPRMDCFPQDLFKELPSLQVLDLSRTNITELPSSVGDAAQLRYLDLSYTSIVELPNSLCNILTLETLKLRGLKLRRLPKAIRRLTSLKHLDVDVSCLMVSMPPGVGDLEDLETLPAFVVRKQHGWKVSELKNLALLQNLCILRLENLSSPKEAKEAALHEKFYIKKLEFNWSRLEDGLEVLESFHPTQYIEELHIVGYGGANFPSWVGDCKFSLLETITIHNCSKCNVLPTLGRLSSLKVLRISHMDEVKAIDQHFLGRNLSYTEDTTNVKAFPMLEQLTFNKMPELNEWIGVEEGDFPNLQILNIASCSKLKALPELHFFQSLEQLEISLCPSIESLSDNDLPVSLESIVIIECSLLKERCRKDVGEDWSKLMHIPSIWIDYKLISQVEE